MKCSEFLDGISPFLDEELGNDQAEIMREHVESCEKCRKVLEKYRYIDNLIRTVPDESPIALDPIDFVRSRKMSFSKRIIKVLAYSMMTIAIASLLAIGFWKSLFDIGWKGNHIKKSGKIGYYISLNDSIYYLSVSGKEVKLLSIEISEGNNTGISISFEKEKKEEIYEKEDSHIVHFLFAFCYKNFDGTGSF